MESGIIGSAIIGALVGYIASRLTGKLNFDLLINIIIGIVAGVAGAIIFNMLEIALGGFIGMLAAAVASSTIVLWIITSFLKKNKPKTKA